MKYNIIFKYSGKDEMGERDFNLDNLNRSLEFDCLNDFDEHINYIKGNKLTFHNSIYHIQNNCIEIIDNEILCVINVISEKEKLDNENLEHQKELDAMRRVSMYGSTIYE
tara:strand:- start:82947 stop:83276 length:330 start_codon:yes stop_codon:yes gene_type:complete